MTTDVYIPSAFNTYKISEVLSQIVSVDLSPLDNDFLIHLENLTFIDPSGIAALYNICMWLRKSENVDATFNIPENPRYKNKKAMKYLEDCGFFKRFFNQEDLYGGGTKRSTTLPIRLLKVTESYQWSQMTLKTWLQANTRRYAEFSNIQVGIEEIFNNIEDHSTQNIGCVFGQYFPNLHAIKITVSDFGVGIPTVMKKKFSGESDIELLEKALEEGVSTKTTPRNRGAGLPNIVRSLTKSKVGTVQILSSHARLVIEDGVVKTRESLSSYYPGTLFELIIDIDNEELYSGEEEDTFEW